MHLVSRTSAVVALIVLSASDSSALAQSAVIDLSKRSGPSKFVSEANGKPARVGVSVDQNREEPGPIAIIPAPQTADSKDPPTDPKSGEKAQESGNGQAADSQPADGQTADGQAAENQTADSPPADGQTPPANKPPGEATASAPDAGPACDPDCDDD